jgi:hypothetical protein
VPGYTGRRSLVLDEGLRLMTCRMRTGDARRRDDVVPIGLRSSGVTTMAMPLGLTPIEVAVS